VYGHVEEALEPEPNRYVFPRYLELVYSESDFIHQIIILAKKNCPLVAIIVPDYEVIYRWAKERQLQHPYNPESIYRSPEVLTAIRSDLNHIAGRTNLQPHEKISAIHLEQYEIPELLILQRQLLAEKYEATIARLFDFAHNDNLISEPLEVTGLVVFDLREHMSVVLGSILALYVGSVIYWFL